MKYQGQSLITLTHNAGESGIGSFSAMMGVSAARSKEIEKQLMAHYMACDSKKYFEMGQFLSQCPIEADTPGELAYAAFLMGKVYRMIESQYAPA